MDGSSPVVKYVYASAAPSATSSEYHTGNYSRLKEVIYPSDTGNTNPTVRHIYDGTDGLIGRVSRILVDQLDHFDDPMHIDYPDINMRNLAEYQRIGMGLTAKVTVSPSSGIFRPVLDRTRNLNGTLEDGGDTYPAYDRFGRVTSHMWVRDDFGVGVSGYANQPPILAVSHTYDRSSNRLTADDARPGAKLPSRDRGFGYDRLQRLIEEERTPLPGGTYASQHKSLQWNLDMLGNWNSLVRDGDEDGSFTDYEGENHTDGRTHNAANEIESNGLVSNPNSDREVVSHNSPAVSRFYQHRYDHAGNMTDQRSGDSVPFGGGLLPGLRMGYDAWNRQVKTEHAGGSTLDVALYTYNALGWRTSKTFDANKGAYDGVMEQKRLFLYDASWRIIEEHIDTDFNTSAGVDWVSQQFWGLRYIDDLVAKRVDRDADGDWADAESTTWYMVTDSQFSVCAVLDGDRHLWERIEYDAYGNARHRYAGDVNGDGRYFPLSDLPPLGGESSLGDPMSDYHADFDVNFDGFVLLSSGLAQDRDLNIITDRAGAMGTALPGGWIGDPSSMDGPDNSIGYCGYVFNAERDDYTVRFRVYAPRLGRWRTRDPIGYADGSSLYEYVRSSPADFIDPTGLKLRVAPGTNHSDVEVALKDLCPAASIDPNTGEITVDCDHSSADSTGCKCLIKIINNQYDNTIRGPATDAERRRGPGVRPNNPSNATDGTGSSFEVIWVPDMKFKENRFGPGGFGPINIPPGILLGHEVCGHGVESNDGKLTHPNDSEDPNLPGVPLQEREAVRIENILRKERNIPPRYNYRDMYSSF